MTYGGQGGMTDRTHTEETKNKLKFARNKRDVEPMLGKKHSDKAKEKMSLARLNNPNKSIQAQNWVESLSKKEMNQIIPILKKLGASKTNIADYSSAKNFLLTNYPTYIDNSGFNVPKLVKLFNDNLTGFGSTSGTSTTGAKSNGVTQYISKQPSALIASSVDKFLLSTIGSKNINQESRDKIMAEINKMIDAGTTTTSKMDKAGKTTVTQTPGYSEERLGEVVSRVAKQGEPGKYEQQRQLNFFDFMQQAEQMRGGR
jgi:uncharacterized Rmd1/YagE family protein